MCWLSDVNMLILNESNNNNISKTIFLLETSCIKMNMLYTFYFFSLQMNHKYPGTVNLFSSFFLFFNNSVHKADMINPIEYVHYLPFNFSQHLHILFCNTEKVFFSQIKRGWGRGRGGRKSSQTQTIPQTILDQKMRTQHLQQHSQLPPLQPGARRIIDSSKIFLFAYLFIFL